MPLRIVITGSSSGIGLRLTRQLLEAGHDVWGLSRRTQTSPLMESGSAGKFSHSMCDVSDNDSLLEAALELSAQWVTFNALICCAGVQGPIGPAMEADPDEWSETIRVNLNGTFQTLTAFFPFLNLGAGHAKLLCLAGGGATAPRANFSAYAASKAGLVRLVETLAQEWTSLPIDINAIAPGALPTAMTAEVLQLGPQVTGEAEYTTAQNTQSGNGEVGFQKLGELVDYLLSAESNGITGRLLSAPWDPWPQLAVHREALADSDIFTLRRIVPADRGQDWSQPPA